MKIQAQCKFNSFKIRNITCRNGKYVDTTVGSQSDYHSLSSSVRIMDDFFEWSLLEKALDMTILHSDLLLSYKWTILISML